MNYMYKKTINNNGQELLLPTYDIEFVHRRLTVGEITDETAALFCSAVRCLSQDKDPITVYIQSPGGSVSAGLYMYDTLKSCDCEVITVAAGLAASMGALVLTAGGTKGHRYALPNAEILIHQPLGGVHGQASEMAIHVEHILRTREKLNHILAESTGQSIERIRADTERDCIMDAETALAYGLVDHIGYPDF